MGPREKITALSMNSSSSRTFPGPGPIHEGLHRFRRDLVNRPIHFGGAFLSEVPGEYGYVLWMIALRRYSDREDLKPVIEIASEEFVSRHMGQIPFGCRQQPDINGIVRVPPNLSNTFSPSARRSLGSRSKGRSPTSSRNRVPRCAISNRPIVRDPRTQVLSPHNAPEPARQRGQ